MKILHVNDLAGVAGCLVKYLRKEGHEADVISFMDDHEFGFSTFYGYRHFNDQTIFRHFLKQLMPQYDIIHLHHSYPVLDWLYRNTDRPIVMHYHGTDLAMNSMDARILDGKCKLILVAGEQLLQYHHRAKWLPTIVDTDHFKHVDTVPRPGGVFTFAIDYLKPIEDKTTRISQIQRSVRFEDMPFAMMHYGSYIDVRHHRQRGLLTDLSKTALEALACGLKVYCNGQWVKELPEQHRPENVVKQLLGYYGEILN